MRDTRIVRAAALRPTLAAYHVAQGAEHVWLYTFSPGLSAWKLVDGALRPHALGLAAFGLPEGFVALNGYAFLERGASQPTVLVTRKLSSKVGPRMALVRFAGDAATATALVDDLYLSPAWNMFAWDAARQRLVVFDSAQATVPCELVDGAWKRSEARIPGDGPDSRASLQSLAFSTSLGRIVGLYNTYDRASGKFVVHATTWDGASFAPLPRPAFLDELPDVKVVLAPVPDGRGDVALFWSTSYNEPNLHVLSGGAWSERPKPAPLRALFSQAASEAARDGTVALASAVIGMLASPVTTWDGSAIVERVPELAVAVSMCTGDASVLAAWGNEVELRAPSGVPSRFPLEFAHRTRFVATPKGFVGFQDDRVFRVDASGVREERPGKPPCEFVLTYAASGADGSLHAIGQSGAKKKLLIHDCVLDGGAWKDGTLELGAALGQYVRTVPLPDGFAIVQASKDKPLTPTIWFVRGGRAETFELVAAAFKPPKYDNHGGLACAFHDATTKRLYLVLVGADGPVLVGHAGEGRFALVSRLDVGASPDPDELDPWREFRATAFAFRAADRALIGEGPVDDRTGTVYAFEAPLGALLDAFDPASAPSDDAASSKPAAKKKPAARKK